MKRFEVHASIAAQPATVWALLTDAPGYPAWNPTVQAIEGRIADGERITVRPTISLGRVFAVKVTEFVPDTRLVWKGGMPLGLFTGTRTFTLTPESDGRVAFTMHEDYAGLMSPLITRSIPDLQPAFDEFAVALKQRAERG